MKGGAHVPRGTRLPFVFVILICTTILMCGWEKTPFLTAILKPPSQLFGLSPDVLVGSPVISVPSEQQIQMHNDQFTFPINETGEKHRAQAVDVTMRLDFPKDMKASNEGTFLSRGGESSDLLEERVSVAVPAPAVETTSRVSMKDNRNLTNQAKEQTCNYARGKWVADDHQPLYSGSGCKKWLSGMWACRMTQRTEFAYEKFRWLPHDCEMEEFEGSKFLKRMQDKTLAFIGDSLARQQFQSLMCMITGGEERPEVMNVGWEFGLVKARGALRPDGWAYRFPNTNTTVLFYWSACLCDLVPLNMSDPTAKVAMHLDQAPAFLRRYLNKFDVLVLNTGHHWNRGKLNANRWVMHLGGMPNTDPKLVDIGRAKNFTIHNIVKWVDYQLSKHPNLKAFYRSISPRHFFNGDWNTGGTCDSSNPLSKGKEVLQDESKDPAPASAVKGTNVKFLDITALSELRDEAHISRYTIRPTPGKEDCLHWCLPGIPDTWNEILFAQL
ncbi:Protein trichome birefringence-like 16 [Ancistrocladus abbreviatus]